MIGATGFEPAITRTPIETVDGPDRSSTLQVSTNNQSCESHTIQVSQRFARFSQNFAARVLLSQRSSTTQAPPRTDSESLLTVKQVAKLLQVCNATMYELCDSGELAHVRILNSIRIAPADLEALIRRRTKVPRGAR